MKKIIQIILAIGFALIIEPGSSQTGTATVASAKTTAQLHGYYMCWSGLIRI
jgi:hypothetical protein